MLRLKYDVDNDVEKKRKISNDLRKQQEVEEDSWEDRRQRILQIRDEAFSEQGRKLTEGKKYGKN